MLLVFQTMIQVEMMICRCYIASLKISHLTYIIYIFLYISNVYNCQRSNIPNQHRRLFDLYHARKLALTNVKKRWYEKRNKLQSLMVYS